MSESAVQLDFSDEASLVRLSRVSERAAIRSEFDRMPQAMRVMVSSLTNEWYTPPVYVEAARSVLGEIDLDPASSIVAQRWVRAKHFYARPLNGWRLPWFGRVWLNPPYGKTARTSNQELWLQRLALEFSTGSVRAGIALCNSALGYDWYEQLYEIWPVCHAVKRIKFIRPDGSDEGEAKRGSSFFYFGMEPERFRSVFRQFGRVHIPEGYLDRIYSVRADEAY